MVPASWQGPAGRARRFVLFAARIVPVYPLAMRFSSSLLVLAVVTLAASACGDDESQTASAATQSSAASTSTSTGSGGAGGTSGTGGAAGSSGTQGGGGLACHGDQVAWDAIPKTMIPCQKNSDCCVVVNTCTSEAQVVAAADSAAAAASWPYCDNDCVNCQPPMIALECKEGQCVGYFPMPDPTKPPELGTNHCGEDGVTPAGGTPPKQHFDCSG